MMELFSINHIVIGVKKSILLSFGGPALSLIILSFHTWVIKVDIWYIETGVFVINAIVSYLIWYNTI